jgi:hypothetical protein
VAAAAAARPLTPETATRIARGEAQRGKLRVDAGALYGEVERIFSESGVA